MLREAIRYDYADIAAVVGRDKANCHHLLARACKRIDDGRPGLTPLGSSVIGSQSSSLPPSDRQPGLRTRGSDGDLLGLMTIDVQHGRIARLSDVINPGKPGHLGVVGDLTALLTGAGRRRPQAEDRAGGHRTDQRPPSA